MRKMRVNARDTGGFTLPHSLRDESIRFNSRISGINIFFYSRKGLDIYIYRSSKTVRRKGNAHLRGHFVSIIMILYHDTGVRNYTLSQLS